MAVNLKAPESLLAIKGVKIAACASGIKKNKGTDLVLIALDAGSTCVGVFTQNKFRAAPVILSEKHLSENSPRLLMTNSGNANAGTGDSGFQNALTTCRFAADAFGCEVNQVIPFSTGVIGECLPIDCFERALPNLVKDLTEDAWLRAATGIMTTDTLAKGVSEQVEIAGKKITITGIAKGSGMIKPNMATMLSYVATDAKIDSKLLSSCLKESVDLSFNAITVDGDTSTNDSCILIATAQSGVKIKDNSEELSLFMQCLNRVMLCLAQSIIRDGEGATKFVEVHVTNTANLADAREVAYTVAHSPLVKTALFASDPNWGRILAAVGRANIADLDVTHINIYLDDVCIVENGARAESYTEAAGQKIMLQDEIKITIDLANGSVGTSVWTSDLSYDYVKINAEYRS